MRRRPNPLLRTVGLITGALAVGGAVAWGLRQRSKCMTYANKAQSICNEIPAGTLRQHCIQEYGTTNCKLFGII